MKQGPLVLKLMAYLQAILYLLIFLSIPSLISGVVSILIKLLNKGMPSEELSSLINNLTSPIMAISYVIVIIAFIIISKARGSNILKDASIDSTHPSFLISGTLLGFGMYGAFQGLIFALTKIIPESWLNLQADQSSSILGGSIAVAMIYTIILAPLCEEIVFRGLILNALDGHMPRTLLIFVGAIAFSLIHMPSPIALVYTFALGLILGVVKFRTNSVLPCILAHIAFNAANYLLLLPKRIGFYIVVALSIPLITYSVIDILRRSKNK